MKPDSCILYEGLALPDYNNKVPDDEVATVPCLDIKAWWRAYLLIKLMQWDNSTRDTLGSSTYTEQCHLHELVATVYVHTVSFHFPFHCSLPYSIPVIRDALGSLASSSDHSSRAFLPPQGSILICKYDGHKKHSVHLRYDDLACHLLQLFSGFSSSLIYSWLKIATWWMHLHTDCR